MKNDASTLIDDYLLGKLNDSEARAVELRAVDDPEFAQELQLQRDILKGIEYYGDEQIKTQIAALDQSLASSGFFNPPHADTQSSVASAQPSGVFRWAVAATVLLLCAGLCWVLFKPSSASTSRDAGNPAPAAQPQPETSPATDPASPVAQARDTEKVQKRVLPPQPDAERLALARSTWSAPDFSNIRAASETSPTVGSRAAEAFRKKQYDNVIQLLEATRPDADNYWPLSELIAHAYFLSGKTELAKRRFSSIAKSGHLPYSERAEWFLLLCHLANFPQEKMQFDVLLKKILADEGHPYFDAAQKLAKQVGVDSDRK